MALTPNQRIDAVALRDLLLKHVVSDDLRVFCFELGEEYETIVGPNDKLQIAIINVIKHFEKRDKLLVLVQRVRNSFPNADWQKIYLTELVAARSSATALEIFPTLPILSRRPGPLRIFLCHASDDKPKVRMLYQQLKSAGYAPWLDEQNLEPGQKWRNEIPMAIADSDVILVCLSQRSVDKNSYIKSEMQFALDIADKQPDEGIFIVPVRLEQCEMPNRLADYQWVDLFDERQPERLLQALSKQATRVGQHPLKPSFRPVISRRALLIWAGAITSSGIGLLSLRLLGTAIVPASTATPAKSQPVSGVKAIETTGLLTEVTHTVVDTPTIMSATDREFTETREPISGSRLAVTSTAQMPEPKTPTSTSPPTETSTSVSPNILTLTLAPGVMMEFVRIPAGEFFMGSDPSIDIKAEDDEQPQHRVYVSEFYICKHEVTYAQYAPFASFAKESLFLHENIDDHPVDVAWQLASDYADWLRQQSNRNIRLPTEAQWEKAARGTDGRIYPWGNDFTASKANTDEEGKVGGTTPVGKYSPAGNSFYGLTDMAGNVWEWCSDWYDETLYQTRQGIVVRDPVGPISGSYHVLRGGSCIFNHLRQRATIT